MKIGAVSDALYVNPFVTSYMNAASNATGNVGSSDADKKSVDPDHQVKPGRKSSPAECETCKERMYQDGSDEGDVSFKAPGHISPEASASRVRAHEQEHVANAYEKQAKGEGKVMSATVSLHTAVCPECGRTYVSGGTTTTLIASKKQDPYSKNARSLADAFGSGQRFSAGV